MYQIIHVLNIGVLIINDYEIQIQVAETYHLLL